MKGTQIVLRQTECLKGEELAWHWKRAQRLPAWPERLQLRVSGESVALESVALTPGEYAYIDVIDLHQAIVQFEADVSEAVRLVRLVHSAEQALRDGQSMGETNHSGQELTESLVREIA